MQFEFYVINYDINKKTTEMFNIFRNIRVQEHTEKAIKKYLRSPKKYKRIIQYKNDYLDREEIAIYGWDALVKEVDSIIQWQERARCEYEISAGEKFTPEAKDYLKDIENYISEGKTIEDFRDKLKKDAKCYASLKSWDCYQQAHANIETIVRDCIRQYKQQIKEQK